LTIILQVNTVQKKEKTMNSLLEFYNFFKDTYVSDTLLSLDQIYGDLEIQSQKFKKDYTISCPIGCGTCCEHFLPEISQAEALMVAVYLKFILKDTKLIDSVLNNTKQDCCPLYNKENPNHCTVYSARPLICRLFGASTNSDKNGIPVFRKCIFNKTSSMPDKLYILNDRPVEMMDYGIRIANLSSSLELLDKAVTRQLEMLDIFYIGISKQ